jgi:thioredoxin-like negative regulator of GroEL
MYHSSQVQCAACGAAQRIAHQETSTTTRCRTCGAPLIRSHSQPLPVTDTEWNAEILGSITPAIVVVWGENCSTCSEYESSVQLMAANLYGKARVLRLNIDHNPATASRYEVRGVPTVLLFREGELLAALEGPRGEQGLKERLGIG